MIVMTGNPLSIRSIARVLNPAARRLSVCSNTRVKPASVFGKVVNSEFMIIYTISSGSVSTLSCCGPLVLFYRQIEYPGGYSLLSPQASPFGSVVSITNIIFACDTNNKNRPSPIDSTKSTNEHGALRANKAGD
jgi:hypothetical protein